VTFTLIVPVQLFVGKSFKVAKRFIVHAHGLSALVEEANRIDHHQRANVLALDHFLQVVRVTAVRHAQVNGGRFVLLLIVCERGRRDSNQSSRGEAQ
jgi:hypothetical protein